MHSEYTLLLIGRGDRTALFGKQVEPYQLDDRELSATLGSAIYALADGLKREGADDLSTGLEQLTVPDRPAAMLLDEAKPCAVFVDDGEALLAQRLVVGDRALVVFLSDHAVFAALGAFDQSITLERRRL